MASIDIDTFHLHPFYADFENKFLLRGARKQNLQLIKEGKLS